MDIKCYQWEMSLTCKFKEILIFHTFNLKLIKMKVMHPHLLDFELTVDDSRIERK